MKAYIGTKLMHAERAVALAAALQKLRHEITYKWWVHGSVQASGEGAPRMRAVAVMEAAAIAESEFVVIILSGGNGTHTELGLAAGTGKHVYIVDMVGGSFDTSPDAPEHTCCFYFLPNVVRIEGKHMSWEAIAELIDYSEKGYGRLVAAMRPRLR